MATPDGKPESTEGLWTQVARGLGKLRDAVVAANPAWKTLGRALRIAATFLFRWTLRLAVVGVLLAPTAMVAMLLGDGDWAPSEHDAFKAYWLSLSVFVAGACWIVLLIAIRVLGRLLSRRILGQTAAPRLFATLALLCFARASTLVLVSGAVWTVVQVGFAVPSAVMQSATEEYAAMTGHLLQGVEGASSSATSAPTDTPPAAPPAPKNAAPPSPPMTGATLFFEVESRFFNRLEMTVRTLGKGLFDRFPVSDLARIVALWLLVALGVRVCSEADLQERIASIVAVNRTRLAETLKRYPALSWQNLGFYVILVAGMFLSLAAITSLPRLREDDKPNNEVSSDALRGVLSQLQISKEDLARGSDELRHNPLEGEAQPTLSAPPPPTPAAPPTAAPPGPTAAKAGDAGRKTAVAPPPPVSPAPLQAAHSADERLASARARSAQASAARDAAWKEVARLQPVVGGEAQFHNALEKAQNASDDEIIALERVTALESVQLWKDRLNDRWEEWSKRQTALVAAIATEQGELLTTGVERYSKENLSRRGSREEVAQFLNVYQWYASIIDHDKAVLNDCLAEVQKGHAFIDHWASASRNAIAVASDPASGYGPIRDATSSMGTVGDRAILEVDDTRCLLATNAPYPQLPKLGESLGPMQSIAGWLLDTDSLPLALIVGMVGFGLLGAAISTFVRERLETQRANLTVSPEAMVSDLAGVVLRGLSAAIVVFLAVQGGLAVLSGTGNAPNPYVLLLACFVAAVFSERVWRAAYERFDHGLTSGGAGDDATDDKSKEQHAPSPAAPTAAAAVPEAPK
jgi:hypothetical protein